MSTATIFGSVSTHPPTQCGLATLATSLNAALLRSPADAIVTVRLLDEAAAHGQDTAGAELVAGDRAGLAASADRLNRCDVVILQHEFGIYGGPDGADVLDLMDRLRVPVVVVFHTVLSNPSARQRQILEAVAAAADAVVTMTVTARERLRLGYAVDLAKVSIIAHGASPMRAPDPVTRRRSGHRPVVLTWGLLGPGKGIEWGIDAMAALGDLRPAPRYVAAGQTHPKVLAHEGEAYRLRLAGRVRDLGLDDVVTLDGRYRDAADLAALVDSADVVLLPYDSTEQVTSGVLTEAVAAGKPVVATAFPHAVELLGDGTGIVVAHRDPIAIAAALRTVLTRPDVAATLSARATSAGSAGHLLWASVAEQYRALARRLISRVAA